MKFVNRSALFTTLFAAAVLAGVMLTSNAAYADEPFEKTAENTVVGVRNIKSLSKSDGIPPWTDSATMPWLGHFVYYGKDKEDNDKPVRYRTTFIIDPVFEGKTMLLDCDTIFDRRFGSSTVWSGSDAQTWLNGDFYNNYFTAPERDAIFETTKTAAFVADGRSVTAYFTPLDKDKVFILGAGEATREPYGYPDIDESCAMRKKEWREGGTGKWWLRTATNAADAVFFVDDDGSIDFNIVPGDSNIGISPAFNIDASSVIFVSKIPNTEKDFKLTVSDNKLGIRVTDGKKVERLGNTITIPYTVTNDTENGISANRVSVLVTDKKIVTDEGAFDGGVWFDPEKMEALQYEKLNVDGEIGTSGTGTFNLPDACKEKESGKDYHVYILAEEVNGAKETDYANVPVEITVPGPKEISVTATGFSGAYDGKAHGITIKVTDPLKGATVKYGTGKGIYDKTASPEYTEVGTYTVYYKITAEGYKTLTGKETIEIKKAEDNTDKPAPAPKTLSGNAIEAMKKGFMAPGDTTVLTKTGKKYYLDTKSDCRITVVKGNKFFIKDIEGKAEFDKQFKKLLSINKKGKVTAKKPAEELRFGFNRKETANKLAVSINIIEPAIIDGKKLKGQAKAGESFDFATTIPLKAEFGKVKNKGVAENLTYEGEAAIGIDGKLHIKGTALKKGKVTIPFKVYGKKFKAVIKVTK